MGAAVAETTRPTDGTARRTTRPPVKPAAVRREVRAQLDEWREDYSDDERARIVARFRL